MTRKIREGAASETSIRPAFLHAASSTSTSFSFVAHEWSFEDSWSDLHWMESSDVEARRSEVVDRILWLSALLQGSAAERAAGIYPNIFLSKTSNSSIPLFPDSRTFDHGDPAGVRGKAHEERELAQHEATLQHAIWRPHATPSSSFPPGIIEFTELAGDHYPDLRDALWDLNGAPDEAREEGLPVPSNTALRNAQRLLHDMYRISPRRFEVYPTPDGEVAIDAPGGFGRSVRLLCDSHGGALCSVNMDGAHRRARYSDSRGLPDGFVREALAELERQDDPAT